MTERVTQKTMHRGRHKKGKEKDIKKKENRSRRKKDDAVRNHSMRCCTR